MADYFYKNSQADEIVFIHEGSGIFQSGFGNITFDPGDYLVIPRGTIHRFHFDSAENRLFIVESFSRSEEHTSELQSLMRISYAVFCLKTKTTKLKSIYYQEIYFKIQVNRTIHNKS